MNKKSISFTTADINSLAVVKAFAWVLLTYTIKTGTKLIGIHNSHRRKPFINLFLSHFKRTAIEDMTTIISNYILEKE